MYIKKEDITSSREIIEYQNNREMSKIESYED